MGALINKKLRLFFFAAVLIAASSICCSPGASPQGETADIILYNGVVYTVDPEFRVVEAVAISGNKVLAVGSLQELEKLAGPDCRKIDLQGKAVVPGLVDAHDHLFGYAASLDRLDLTDTKSAEEIAAKVAAKAEEVGPGAWIVGRGWDQNDWPVKEFPTHHVLDAAAPDNPVVLTRIDGHANWANARAMELGGVTRDTADPAGGEIIRDAEGNPTGVFIDTAESLVARNIPGVKPERLKVLLNKAIQNCLEVGLTGVHDMGGGTDNIEMVKNLIDEDNFPFRVYFNLSAELSNLDEILSAGPQDYGDGKLVVRSVKTYADGALGSRGAALLEPYSDRPDSSGLIMNSTEELQAITERCLKAGFQVSTHAIGDRGNRMTLDAYEAALKNVPSEEARLRIEHAQVLAPEDIPRFAELGVLPSMQPTHCTSDFPWALDRLGPERAKGAYAWRSLIDTGVVIPCGSDFPVEKINPMLGFYAAITRQHEDGTPEGGYFPEQKMTREEALKGFTIWAAYAAFAEDWLGSLEPGKRADLVVLDRDITKVPPREILEARPVLTIIDGRIVLNKEN
jgi:predicted amidohydrolase YtcJ